MALNRSLSPTVELLVEPLGQVYNFWFIVYQKKNDLKCTSYRYQITKPFSGVVRAQCSLSVF